MTPCAIDPTPIDYLRERDAQQHEVMTGLIGVAQHAMDGQDRLLDILRGLTDNQVAQIEYLINVGAQFGENKGRASIYLPKGDDTHHIIPARTILDAQLSKRQRNCSPHHAGVKAHSADTREARPA